MSFWKKVKKSQYELYLASSIIIYALTFSWFTISEHNSFTIYAWDLGIFDQGFWTTINFDRVFYYTCELHLNPSGSFFGIHFSPILFTLKPFYYLSQRAETILILQSFILALSAVPIYKIASLYQGKRVSCLLACLYLLNPSLHGVNSYDFHVQAFLPLILGYVLYFTLSKKWLSMVVAINLSLAVQEQVFYLIAAYMVFLLILLIRDKEAMKSSRIALILLSITLSAVLWKTTSSSFINYFNLDIPAHLKAGQHYAVLGVNDPLKIPLYSLIHPLKVLEALNYEWYYKIGYLLSKFAPYLLAASQFPLFLIPTVPWFAISLLSNYPPYYRIGFQYSAYIIPFIYTGFIIGASKLIRERDQLFNEKFLRILTVLCIIISLSLSPISPLTWGLHLSPAYEKPNLSTRNLRLSQIRDMIPDNASVLTQDNLFSHLSNRLDAYVMVPPTFKDIKTWKDAINWITDLKTDYILIDLETDSHSTIKYAFSPVRQHNYQLLAFYDNIYLYELNYIGATISYEPVNQTYTYTDLIPQNMKERQDPNSTVGTIPVYQNMSIQTRTLWYGPYEIAPRGNYTVTYRLMTSNNKLNESIQLDAFTNRTVLNSVEIRKTMLENNTWTDIELNITLTKIAYDLELRGILAGGKHHTGAGHYQG